VNRGLTVCGFYLPLINGVEIAQSVQRQATGWTARVRFPAMQDSSLLHSVQTGSGTHPASYPLGTGALSSEVKRPGREADHSSPSNPEVKNGGAIPPLPPPQMSSWGGS
jgi:hypothetical protein